MRKDLFVKPIHDELEYWPGVKVDFHTRGRHREANFTFEDRSRFIILPMSTRDPARAPKNAVATMRETLRELGAKRLDALPTSKREREEVTVNMAAGAPPRVGITDSQIFVVIPKGSKQFDMFADKNGKPKGHWSLELRANPNMQAEPFLAVVKKELPAGKQRQPGMVGGSYSKGSAAFQVIISNAQAPLVVEKFGHFRTTGAIVRSKGDNELVLELPPKADRKPVILRGEKKLEALTAPPPPPEPEVVEEPVAETPMLGGDFMQQLLGALAGSQQKMPEKMMLHLPERPMTVERAVNYLNKRIQEKTRQNLRITVDHDTGLLSYVEKGGPGH